MFFVIVGAALLVLLVTGWCYDRVRQFPGGGGAAEAATDSRLRIAGDHLLSGFPYRHQQRRR